RGLRPPRVGAAEPGGRLRDRQAQDQRRHGRGPQAAEALLIPARVMSDSAASVRYGTASEVFSATAPPSAAPAAWPGAHARLIRANAYPYTSPRCSAACVS